MLVRYTRSRRMHHRACLYRQSVPDHQDRRGDWAEEVAARVVPQADPQSATPVPGVVVDRERRTASVGGRLLSLAYLEFELLAHLVAHPRRVHSREQLLNQVWGQPAVGDARTVDVHISRLRRKLGPAYRDAIVTVRRVGYTYDPARVRSL